MLDRYCLASMATRAAASRRFHVRSQREKPILIDRLEVIIVERSLTGNTPSGPSRWSTNLFGMYTGQADSWSKSPTIIYGRPFPPGPRALAPDKKARQCTMDQLQQKFVSPKRCSTKRSTRWSSLRFRLSGRNPSVVRTDDRHLHERARQTTQRCSQRRLRPINEDGLHQPHQVARTALWQQALQ